MSTTSNKNKIFHYFSATAGVPAYENTVQAFTVPATGLAALLNVYALNNSASQVYLMIQDSANAGVDAGPCAVYPVPSNSFINVGEWASQDFPTNGLYLSAFTDPGCTVSAGNVMHYKVDYQLY